MTPGFWLLLALSLLAGAGTVLPLVLLASLCHELGHVAAWLGRGPKWSGSVSPPLERNCVPTPAYMPYGRELLCTLAGPAVNLRWRWYWPA